MAFDDLVPQSSINPDADRYGAECLLRSGTVAASWPCTLDVPYGPEPEHRLDVYRRPSPATGVAPVLVFFHGGGFTHGYKEWCGFMAPALTPAVLVAVRYRLMPSVAYPDPWLDAVRAVAWVHAHIHEHGGDAASVFIGGHSAGGAIAATIATREEWLAVHGLRPSAIAGVLSVSATLNAFAVTGSAASAYQVGDELPLDPEAPLARVAHATAPFYLAWGGRERQRARVERSSQAFMAALGARGIRVESHFLPDADHFATHLALGDPATSLTRSVREWMGLPALPADAMPLSTQRPT